MPLIYEAAGVHKKAIALATSFASPKRFAGTEALITPAISSSDFHCFSALSDIILFNLFVFVNPGKTLLTVMP